MKSLKLKKYITIFLITFVIIVIPLYYLCSYYYNNYILVQNVFDHMYYAKAYNNIISEEKPPEMNYHWQETFFTIFKKDGYYNSVSYYDEYLDSPFNFTNPNIKIEIDSPLLPILELDSYNVSEYGGMYIIFTTQFEKTNNVP